MPLPAKEFINDHILHAREVLDIEIEGLEALKTALDEKFSAAIEILYAMKGRAIVSGMGKSGHIARKIAATLASTGTPAHFVHPGEASHGDLGMITRDDVVVVLSNSGETSELQDIIYYTKRFNIPLIAIVRRKTSALVSAATIALILPEIPEASPIGVPTTSTTMMVALGDAIAVALLEKHGFTQEDFGVYHPGGKLGKSFVKVKELMHKDQAIPLVSEDVSMADVILEMTRKSLGCAGVISKDEELLGMITDGDLRRHMQNGILERVAKEVMTVNPLTVSPDMLAVEALGIMNRRAITNLFIIDDQKRPLGILHIHDLLRAGIA